MNSDGPSEGGGGGVGTEDVGEVSGVPKDPEEGGHEGQEDEQGGCGELGRVERVTLPPDWEVLGVEQWGGLWDQQAGYIDQLEGRLRELEDKTRSESSRREHLLVMRLTAKEGELQEMSAQIAELKAAQAPSTAALRSTLLDPAVNLVIQRLTRECDNLKKQAEEAQNELAAWKFTPDSATGKRLMAKCRQLYQENEELGKMIASGRLAKLEGELALQKNLTEEMKKNQQEMDEFMAELDEDVEGMQSTIYYLQQQLREARETISRLETRNGPLETRGEPPQMNGDARTAGDNDPETKVQVKDNKHSKEEENGVMEDDEEEEIIAGLDDSERFDSPEQIAKGSSRTSSPSISRLDRTSSPLRTKGLRTESPLRTKGDGKDPVVSEGGEESDGGRGNRRGGQGRTDSPAGKRGRGRGRGRNPSRSDHEEETSTKRGKRKRGGQGRSSTSKRSRRTAAGSESEDNTDN